MITILNHSTDALLAAKISEAVRQRGYELADGVQPGADHIAIAVISPHSVKDQTVMDSIYRALDSGQHVIPVLAAATPMPQVLTHLETLDFSQQVQADALEARIAAALAPGARRPMKVLTPRTRRSNQRALLFFAGLIVFLCSFFTWGIITFDIESPAAEYQKVWTEEAGTIQFFLRPTMEYLSTYLPRSTEQAAVFPATLEAVQTRARPFVAQTATAIYDALADIYSTPTPVE